MSLRLSRTPARAVLAAALASGLAGIGWADLGAGHGGPAPGFFDEFEEFPAEAEADLVPLNNIFNPARGEKASFRYTLNFPGHVKLRIYTRTGMLVVTLVDEQRPAGASTVDWRGLNSAGDTVASGVYLARITGPGLARTHKVVVVK